MKIEIKSPTECSSAELSLFQKLIIEGDEVNPNGLLARIIRAEKLVFIYETECVAIGAIKKPNEDYKLRLFVKAGVEEKASKYIYELGWIYIIPTARNQGLGHELMKAIQDALGSSSCYATTKENNEPMHRLFSKYKFEKLGSPYKGNEDYSLVLYINTP